MRLACLLTSKLRSPDSHAHHLALSLPTMLHLTRPVPLETGPLTLLENAASLDAFVSALYSAIVVSILSTAVVGIFTGMAFVAFIVLL